MKTIQMLLTVLLQRGKSTVAKIIAKDFGYTYLIQVLCIVRRPIWLSRTS